MSLIEVKGLRKRFGAQEVLKGIDLTIEQGERVAIIGGSGCGKSMFLRCLELLETPDAGQIFIDGQEITARGAKVNQIRRSIGMVYQEYHLFSEMDVMDNLCLAPVLRKRMTRPEAENKAMELLEQVGLATKARAWPSELSGGQQQRIAICRCLMMEPKILLFDEPTSALDPTMVGEVLAVIRMLAKQELAMLIVTHQMSFAREVADRVLFFADGGIYEQGTPAEIFDSPKREKTVAFIRKIKYFTFEIKEKHFDLMALYGGIQNFVEKYGIDLNRSTADYLCARDENLTILMDYSDAEDSVLTDFVFNTLLSFDFSLMLPEANQALADELSEVLVAKKLFSGFPASFLESVSRCGIVTPDEAGNLLRRTENMQSLSTLAILSNLPQVLEFVDKNLESLGCSASIQLQLDVAVEEIFVNIASYAYGLETGPTVVRFDASPDPACVTITFMDHGVPYDPLAKPDPDIALPLRERKRGGLGIFMAKQYMDDITYQHKDGQNILTLKKRL